MKPKYVNVDDCIPMPQTERKHYNERSYNYLKKVIARDSFKQQYAVRAIFDKKLKKYLVFDGAHRIKAAKALGIKKIPLVDETETLTIPQAIAEGIKANSTHAYYNALDIAQNLKELSNSISSSREHRTVGRPETVSLTTLSDLTGFSEQSISRYLQLFRLPEEVQTLVGQGKIGMTNAIVLLKLAETAFENMILQLAQEAVSKGISRRELEKRVAMIKKKGYYNEDKKMCVGCHSVYSSDRVSYPCLCPECVGKLRSRNLGSPNQKRTIAMLRFLNLRNWAEKRHKTGYEFPDWFFVRLEQLQQEWKGESNSLSG